MKIRLLLFILYCFSLFASCGKVELLDDSSSHDSGSSDSGGKPIHPGEIGDSSCYTIAELAGIENGKEVLVGGYIVGYVPSGSISRTQFSAENAVVTNIVLADALSETNYKKCAPMQLLKNTDVRDDLNLSDHPENLGEFVVLFGKKDRYYNAPGLKPVEGYTFAEIGGGDSDTPVDPEVEDKVYPILSQDPPTVLDGR